MIEGAIYTILACIEGIAYFFITFGLFRISFKEHIKEIAVTVFLVSLGTYIMSEIKILSDLIPLLNIILLMIFLIFVFKVSVLYSMFIAVSGYVICMLVQWVLVTCSGIFLGIDLNDIKDNIVLTRFFQVLSSSILIGISVLMRRNHMWYTFIPFSNNFKVTKNNIIFLAISFIITVFFGASLKIHAGVLIWVICLATILIMAHRKEYE